jgi:hypothetical protein
MKTAKARSMAPPLQQPDRERIARRQAERMLAGMRSAVVRLQALVTKQKAEAAAAKAAHFG